MRTPDQMVRDTELILEGHKPCPTCPGSRPLRCCNCDAALEESENKLMPDPYNAVVDDDPRPHLQCRTCWREAVVNARDHGGMI